MHNVKSPFYKNLEFKKIKGGHASLARICAKGFELYYIWSAELLALYIGLSANKVGILIVEQRSMVAEIITYDVYAENCASIIVS